MLFTSPVNEVAKELNDPSALTRKMSTLLALKAHRYFSSLENINGSNLIFCLTTEKSVTARRVESDVVTVRFLILVPSLVIVTTLAAGLVDVRPDIALRAVKILSAVVSFETSEQNIYNKTCRYNVPAS